jgi:hypothetical protein
VSDKPDHIHYYHGVPPKCSCGYEYAGPMYRVGDFVKGVNFDPQRNPPTPTYRVLRVFLDGTGDTNDPKLVVGHWNDKGAWADYIVPFDAVVMYRHKV